ncbi:prevent-host-death protein [Leucobacter insecticola]|uniref:Prevent-host-death protein n=1 Tax=Leucobacter insecticola TaxID=2714934 RepID=A0A6G8FK30_9MICO|nr:prevent-host-death protein [Leucobacter insecticola]QIM16725.1 prevent-host-death protein [Leucobacter insecticola]
MNTATANRQEFKSSELSRNSGEVFAAAENGPVTVTRRDADSLVLMNKREAEIRKQLFEFAAQLIAITTDDRGTLADRMSDHFPWMFALSETDKAQCAKDLVNAARASFATEQPHLAIAELNSWRETAEAIAAGHQSTLVEWLDHDNTVARP